jgi:3-dehydroquinate dehydratase-2
MKILVINGPNLNKLGGRNPEQYGRLTLEEINDLISSEFPKIDFHFAQSNHEGEIVDLLQSVKKENFEGVIINPGGYAHSSVAIRDALEMVKVPKVEVHLSNLAKREEFRKQTITASAIDGYLSGFGHFGYFAAVYLILKLTAK